MKRLIDYHLKLWKSDRQRKPLIIRGARQVGKTHSVREFGLGFKNFVEINFEKNNQAGQLFEGNIEPQKILMNLSLLTRQDIVPEHTLLFFDEIQEAPRVLTALRYFYEDLPELHIVAAGSLLEFAIEQVGVPVGRVSFLHMYPVSFLEYLAAVDSKLLVAEMLEHQVHSELSVPTHHQMMEHVFQYMALGGMPESLALWLKTKDPRACYTVQHDILGAYRQDFNKYAKKFQIKYLDLLFNQVPHQLGSKFKFSHIDGDYKKRELSPCLDLLQTANIAHKVTHSSGNGVPIGAEAKIDKFKVIFLDVALIQSILGEDQSPWFLNAVEHSINKGPLIEAFVGQELLAYSHPRTALALYYWQRESRGAQAEVDYMVQKEGKIIPIEVKSGHGGHLKSLHSFLDSHTNSPYGVRFSKQNYSVYQKIHSVPLYAIASLFLENREAVDGLY